MRIAILLVLACGLVGCTSAGGLPGLSSACDPADDECPPVEPIRIAGHQEPVYRTIQQPIYEERRTPVWGEKTVPVFQTRRKPVTITLPDACGDCDRVVELWDTEEQVQVGVRRVPACIGYKVEKVQVGSCPKRVLVGWRTVEEHDPCAPAPVQCP
ncbi:MAG: hypothetical protein QNJ90_09480 [Planctomycetota bacterium]|nr:hypothetical protein [Planctomycetota bacterium]